MKKTATLLPAAIVVAGLGIATDSNAKSAARSSMSDQAYCQLLSDLHRASDEQNMDAAMTEAINECNKGKSTGRRHSGAGKGPDKRYCHVVAAPQNRRPALGPVDSHRSHKAMAANLLQIPAAQGGKWHRTSVGRLLHRLERLEPFVRSPPP